MLHAAGKSAGKSGQRFYITANESLIIKTISSEELAALRKMLAEYSRRALQYSLSMQYSRPVRARASGTGRDGTGERASLLVGVFSSDFWRYHTHT